MVFRMNKKVYIPNARLQYLFYLIMVPMGIGAIIFFVFTKRYTMTIANSPRVKVIWHLDNMMSLNMAAAGTDHYMCEEPGFKEWKPMIGDARFPYGSERTICRPRCVPNLPPQLQPANCIDLVSILEEPSAIEATVETASGIVTRSPPSNPAISPLPEINITNNPYPAVQGAVLSLEISYQLKEAAPWFFGIGSTSVQTKGTQKNSNVLALDAHMVPFKLFEAGEDLGLTVSEIAYLWTDDTSRSQDPNVLPYGVFKNGGEAVLTARCYNDFIDLPEIHWDKASTEYSIAISSNEPLCLLSVTLSRNAVNRWGIPYPDPSAPGTGTMLMAGQVDVRVRTEVGDSYHRLPDVFAVLLNLVSLSFVLSVPSVAVSLVARYCLGGLSTIYRRAITDVCHLEESVAKYASQVMVQRDYFSQSEEKPVSNFAQKSKLHFKLEQLNQRLSPKLSERELERLARVCQRQVTIAGMGQATMLGRVRKSMSGRSPESTQDSSQGDFQQKAKNMTLDFDLEGLACGKMFTRETPLTFSHLAKLFGRDEKRSFLENFFSVGIIGEPEIEDTKHDDVGLASTLGDLENAGVDQDMDGNNGANDPLLLAQLGALEEKMQKHIQEYDAKLQQVYQVLEGLAEEETMAKRV